MLSVLSSSSSLGSGSGPKPRELKSASTYSGAKDSHELLLYLQMGHLWQQNSYLFRCLVSCRGIKRPINNAQGGFHFFTYCASNVNVRLAGKDIQQRKHKNIPYRSSWCYGLARAWMRKSSFPQVSQKNVEHVSWACNRRYECCSTCSTGLVIEEVTVFATCLPQPTHPYPDSGFTRPFLL